MTETLFATLLMYADDGLFYGMKKFTEKQVVAAFRGIGIDVNLEKSGWIRENWKWRKPLKFLGLEYNGEIRQLRSSTREGATLKYDKAGLIESANKPELIPSKTESLLAQDYYLVYSPKGEHEACETIKEARALRLVRNNGRPSG